MHRERLVTAALTNAAVVTTAVALPGLELSVVTVGTFLVVIGAALAARTGRERTAYACCAVALALTSLVVLGYVYGADPTGDTFTGMTFASALALLLGALAALSMIPGGIVHWVVYGHDAGAIMQRRLLPVALVLLPLLGLLRLFLQRSGIEIEKFAMAANITVASTTLVAITIQAARRLRNLDNERSHAVEALRSLNEDLAEMVRERSEELERERTRVALLRDRDRIARELHDRVIQRLFASGLQLTSLQATLEPRTARRVDDVVNDLDGVIRELRKTIFALEMSKTSDPSAALAGTVRRVGRILGFSPTLEVIGDPAILPEDLSGHVLAVAHEALSNVIRHAGASTISVVLDVNEHRVLLAVEDDGKGLPKDIRRRSGLANIESRARELGGSLTWGHAVPHGTLLIFEAPLRLPITMRARPGLGAAMSPSEVAG